MEFELLSLRGTFGNLSRCKPGCFYRGMQPGCQCCCAAFQPVTRCRLGPQHATTRSWSDMVTKCLSANGCLENPRNWVALKILTKFVTSRLNLKVLPTKIGRAIELGKVRMTVATWHHWSTSSHVKMFVPWRGWQYLLLDLGGGCFGMDSFQGEKAPWKPLNTAADAKQAKTRVICHLVLSLVTCLVVELLQQVRRE